jgi:hypothetical protein
VSSRPHVRRDRPPLRAAPRGRDAAKADDDPNYRIILGRHLGFGSTQISKLAPSDIDAYIGAKRSAGLAIKTPTT